MSKRFTATEKWDKSWFRKLPPRLKCLWQFFCDRCDQSGVLDMDWELASFQIGEDVSPADVAGFEDRVYALNGSKLWIPSFVEFQYGVLSPTCPAHKPVFRSIQKQFPNGYPIPYQYPINRLQEEEEEKEEEKEAEEDKEKEGGKRNAWLPSSEQVEAASWFNRKPTTEWSKREKAAWAQIQKTEDFCGDNWLALRWYYSASGCKFLRRDLLTLLNNWNGEIDRAKNYTPDAK